MFVQVSLYYSTVGQQSIDETLWDAMIIYIQCFKTSKGACVFSILMQDASEALNLIFQLSVLVVLTINTDPSFINPSAPLEKYI